MRKNKLLLLLALLLTAVGGAWAQTQWESGSCTVTLNNGTLTVSGNGTMADYADGSDRPWDNNSGDITSVVVGEGISNNQVEMISGNTLQLGVVFTPSNTTRTTVVYSSDNEAVATVSADGVITAHDNGWATITIRNAEWPYASTKLKVHVTGATLPVAGDEVSQGEAEARKMESPDE